MPSSVNNSAQPITGSSDASIIQNAIKSIEVVISYVSNAKKSIPSPPKTNTTTTPSTVTTTPAAARDVSADSGNNNNDPRAATATATINATANSGSDDSNTNDISSHTNTSLPIPSSSNTAASFSAISSSTSAAATTSGSASGSTSTSTSTSTSINVTANSGSDDSNTNDISSHTNTSLPIPSSSNIAASFSANSSSTSAAATTSGSTSGSTSTSTSTSTSSIGSNSGSGSASTATGNGVGNSNTSTSNDANSKDEISDGSCWMLGFPNKKPSEVNKMKDSSSTVDDSNEGVTNSDQEMNQKLHNQLEKLCRDLEYIQNACKKLQGLEKHVEIQVKTLQQQGQLLESIIGNKARVKNGTTSNNAILNKQLQNNVKAITEMVMELKHHIPSPYKLNLANEGDKNEQTISGVDSLNWIDEMLKIRDNKTFQGCSSFEDFEGKYQSLQLTEKLCLLCFSVFPENAIVKKRVLMYWWIGEGFIDPKVGGNKMPEEVANAILKLFLDKGFVEPEIKKRRLVGFKVHPLIRYAVISKAEKAGFVHFNPMGNPSANFSTCQRACLIKTGEKYSRQVLHDLEPEKLHALFNVNDPYPDLNAEWFSRMRNINVLCLGRWESSSKKHTRAEETKHHVEVDSTEFLKGLRNMKHLKFISLQGISRINELPETIERLTNLRILDLNACHNLEALPETIVSLQKLTHLDISECYFLDCMPKGLGSLTELQVLKGFVISNLKIKNAGTLDDIKGLKNLRKLSIYTTKKDFPRAQDLDALRQITELQKLSIAWGGKSQAKKEQKQSDSRKLTRTTGFRQEIGAAMIPDPPNKLVKLDLQCCPETNVPGWLSPGKLEKLQKLYIRGGHLQDLGQAQGGVKWNVKILRLKFLQELKMDWKALREAFPHLIYLEKFNCPKLTLFPCDGNGVWLDKEKLEKEPLEDLEFSWSLIANRST